MPLFSLLASLTSSADKFTHCVLLFDHTESLIAQAAAAKGNPEDIRHSYELYRASRDAFVAARSVYSSWLRAAANEAAMTLHDIGTTIEDLDEALASSGLLGSAPLAEAKRLMGKHFAHWVAIRHSVAHQRDLAKAARKNSLKGKMRSPFFSKEAGSELFIGSTLHGRTLNTTRKGTLLTLDISHENDTKIEDILRAIRTAISPLYFEDREFG
ncbi:MAG: hypothetical protein ACT6XY_00605 [Phreatobacter sp.]|uniref:hypothetical protein n=1 Tax=Phreatobacter sp. TaxID=1966341 RepID=UPI004034FF48